MMSLPRNTILGQTLSVESILLYYEGPQLFVCQNERGQSYLALLTDQSDDLTEMNWLYAAVDAALVEGISAGKVDVREVFQRGSCVYRVAQNDDQFSVLQVPASELRDDELPEAQTYIHAMSRETTFAAIPSKIEVTPDVSSWLAFPPSTQISETWNTGPIESAWADAPIVEWLFTAGPTVLFSSGQSARPLAAVLSAYVESPLEQFAVHLSTASHDAPIEECEPCEVAA